MAACLQNSQNQVLVRTEIFAFKRSVSLRICQAVSVVPFADFVGFATEMRPLWSCAIAQTAALAAEKPAHGSCGGRREGGAEKLPAVPQLALDRGQGVH